MYGSSYASRFQVDLLEQDALEIIRLLRSTRNALAPINRTPPEVLTLIPNFWKTYCRNRDIIALTHVCQAWRETFISRSCLWTDFYCMDADKTRVYLERSKSSPINLWLDERESPPPHDQFLQIFPHAVDRLKSLAVKGTLEYFQDITTHLSHPTPLLEVLWIRGHSDLHSEDYPTLAPTLFNGDLSSLRKLFLQSVHTELPWKNMVNLTSFTLNSIRKDGVSIEQLLDFLESAPNLLKIKLHHATPISGAQNGRVLSLPCLKRLEIRGNEPSSLFLDHLLIPVGTKMISAFRLESPGARIEDYLPSSLDSFGNLSGFTRIRLYFGSHTAHLQFTGPNGCISLFPTWEGLPSDTTSMALRSLALFDTSTVRELETMEGGLPPGSPLLHQALAPMKEMRTLKLVYCQDLLPFISALATPGPSNTLACPKLEELELSFVTVEQHDIASIVGMAAARVSRGVKLNSVHFAGLPKLPPSLLGLADYVSHVKISSPWITLEDSDEDSSDDED